MASRVDRRTGRMTLVCHACGEETSRLWVERHGKSTDKWVWVCDRCWGGEFHGQGRSDQVNR